MLFRRRCHSDRHTPPAPGRPPAHRSGAQAVRVLAAAPAVAVCAGVTGPATPAVALVVGQARADDRRTYLAAVGMLAATSTPVLTQVRHWGQGKWLGSGDRRGTAHLPSPTSCLLTCARAAVPFVAQAALAAVTRSAHGLGRAGGGAHGLQLCPRAHPPAMSRSLLAARLSSHLPPPPPCLPQCAAVSAVVCARAGRHKPEGHSPSCTSQRGPVQPSSQKQEPEPPRPWSQWPCTVQRQAGERGQGCGGGTWAAGIREQGRTRQPTLAVGPKGTRGAEFTC